MRVTDPIEEIPNSSVRAALVAQMFEFYRVGRDPVAKDRLVRVTFDTLSAEQFERAVMQLNAVADHPLGPVTHAVGGKSVEMFDRDDLREIVPVFVRTEDTGNVVAAHWL